MAEILARGIDVSYYQGKIDWKKVKESGKVDFVIIKSSFGKVSSQVDPQFENNYKGCKENGIPCGVYHFGYALTEKDAKLEAEVLLNTIKGKTFEYPIYYDFEWDGGKPANHRGGQFALSKEVASSVVDTFCSYVQSQGYWIGIYASDSWFNSHFTTQLKNKYAVWSAKVKDAVGNISTIPPIFATTYKMWQYSWVGRIDGINTNVDTNYCYIDYPTLIKNKKLNGYDKVDSIPTKPVSNSSTPKYLVDYQNEQKSQIIEYDYLTQGNLYLSPHFQVKEFRCEITNTILIDNRLIWILERLYKDLNLSKCVITSGYRTPQYSISVGGYATDFHTKGMAFDATFWDKKGKQIDSKLVCCKLCDYGDVFGIGFIGGAVHCDSRNKSQIWFGDETNGNSIIKLGYTCFQDYWNINSDGTPKVKVTYKLTATKDNLTESEVNQLKIKLNTLGVTNVKIEKE